jgi:hypothetical protein
MGQKSDLDEALDRYEAFLSNSRAPGAAHWSEQLRTARRELSHAPRELAARLLSFYGGMGSINDIVTRLGKETERYQVLNERLYQACQSTLGRHGDA